MNLNNALILSFFSGLITMIGIVVTYIKVPKEKLENFLVFMLSFSLGIMIIISISELIPKSLIYILKLNTLYLYLLIGSIFIIIYIFIKKIKIKNNNSLYRVGIISLIILMLHNIPEGIITYISSSYDIKLGYKMLIAITLHNIPEGITIALPIYYSTKKREKSVVALLFASLAEPLGALITHLFLYKYITNTILAIIYIEVGLLMIILSIENILPEALSYNKNKYIIIGLICSTLLFIIELIINFI